MTINNLYLKAHKHFQPMVPTMPKDPYDPKDPRVPTDFDNIGENPGGFLDKYTYAHLDAIKDVVSNFKKVALAVVTKDKDDGQHLPIKDFKRTLTEKLRSEGKLEELARFEQFLQRIKE